MMAVHTLIIIATYNAQDYIINCFESLISQTCRDFEVIVVDNNSQDKTKDIVKSYIKNHSYIHLIENIKNHGFARACNIALKSELNSSKFTHILLLNQDTVVEKNLLELFYYWSERIEAGILSPKILIKKNHRIWWMGSKILSFAELFKNLKLALSYHLNKEKEDIWHFENPRELEAISGCVLFIPKYIMDDVGYFDEKFFMYGEDLDYSLRLKEKGFKMYLIPGTIVYHDVNIEHEALIADNNIAKTTKRYYLNFKSNLLLLHKHFPIFYKIIWYFRIPFAVAYEIYKRVLRTKSLTE
jgi:GT2 family glycosyltransferase